MKRLLSGNEAIALGAYHAGVKVAAAYPGTPSTEILEALARCDGVYAEWAPNEKVALEVGMGASYAGARALVSMKHVGLNVAADPFFAASVTGVRGGLLVVSADDPGMHSSQNEQDNRHYARFAKVPMLEPSDSQEAYDLTQLAFDISERFDTPVLLRTTTRISHSKSIVDIPEVVKVQGRPVGFQRDPAKYVMLPVNARRRHPLMEDRLVQMAAYSESFPYNCIEPGDPQIGVITSGVAYQYAREVFPTASFLKLTLTHPLPIELMRRFARQVKRLVVVEELDPYLEEAVRAYVLPDRPMEVIGKSIFPLVGELSIEVVEAGARAAGLLDGPTVPAMASKLKLPSRPPVLCPGCPHSATFYVLKRLGFYRGVHDPTDPPERQILGDLRRQGLVITGDIGCYTLSALPPLLAMDTCGCMGASIGQALGMQKAGIKNKVVAVIGDSTFFHSGMTPLLDVVYNRGAVTTIILDNATTAMTGHQDHPGSGATARGEPTRRVLPEEVARALGVEDVRVVNAFDPEAIEAAIRGCVESDRPAVIVVRGPCALQAKISGEALHVLSERCDGCAACLRVGCPAISYSGGRARIDPALCVGPECGVCGRICPQEAIGNGIA